MSAFRWTLLDRYLLRQLIQTVAFLVVLLSIIWLAPETMFEIIQNLFAGTLTFTQALELFLYNIPAVMLQTIPMSVLVGTVFLVRQMSHNFELVALMGTGLSPRRLVLPMLGVGLLFGALQFFVQEQVVPITTPRMDQRYAELGVKQTQANSFVYVQKDAHNTHHLDKFFLIQRVAPNKLEDFLVLYYQYDGASPETDPSTESDSKENVRVSRILRAPTGIWQTKSGHWQLQNGMEYVLDENGVYRETRRFETAPVETGPYPVELLAYQSGNPTAMPWPKLAHYLHLLQESGQRQDVPYFRVRLHQKWAIPLASVLFVVLGALLGMEPVRSQKLFGLTATAVVLFIYAIMVPFSTNLGGIGLIPGPLAALLPLAIAAGATALALWIRDSR